MDYDRDSAVRYAARWAYGRNPKYYDFENIGGDCTNFASQCIFSGSGIMNYTQVFGWYYIDINRRTPSWSGVEYLYDFLTKNKGAGPYAEETSPENTYPGDIVQLGDISGKFYHSPVITLKEDGELYVSAHSIDAHNRALDTYVYDKIRFLHILGVRE